MCQLADKRNAGTATCRRELSEAFGITFSRLFALNNMPIKRYVDYLRQRGQLEEYMQLLVTSFNVAAAEVCCSACRSPRASRTRASCAVPW